jgi:hypothetical protein
MDEQLRLVERSYKSKPTFENLHNLVRLRLRQGYAVNDIMLELGGMAQQMAVAIQQEQCQHLNMEYREEERRYWETELPGWITREYYWFECFDCGHTERHGEGRQQQPRRKYRRNADTRLRELERLYSTEQSEELREQLSRERERQGLPPYNRILVIHDEAEIPDEIYDCFEIIEQSFSHGGPSDIENIEALALDLIIVIVPDRYSRRLWRDVLIGGASFVRLYAEARRYSEWLGNFPPLTGHSVGSVQTPVLGGLGWGAWRYLNPAATLDGLSWFEQCAGPINYTQRDYF